MTTPNPRPIVGAGLRPAPTGLRICCLGAFQATLDGAPLAFETDKARALLAYLAVEPRRLHPRQRLAGLLWSDQPEEKALHSLRQTLSALRKTLGDDAPQNELLTGGRDVPAEGLYAHTPFLLVQRESVQLNPACDIRLDVEKFNFLQKLNFLNVRRLQQALALYHGPFLDQFYLSGSPLFEEWAAVQREALNQQAVAALEQLVDYHERRGEYALARQAAQRLTELAAWDENAHARLMRLYAQDGLWSAANNQYQRLRRVLHNELGVETSPETARLFQEIRRAAAENTPLPPRYPPAAHNLPAAFTPFIGRQAELDRLADLLADPACRMVILLGPGGMGKTRLALQAAAAQVGVFTDGVYFISLERSNIGTLERLNVPTLIANGLGFQFYSPQDLPGQLLDYLRSKQMLLILDNYESLLQSHSNVITLERSNVETEENELLAEIVRQAAGVKLLITSRAALDLHSATVVEVGGLNYPASDESAEAGAEAYNVQRIDVERSNVSTFNVQRSYDALELFIQTAQRANPNLNSKISHLHSPIARICRMLEGAPLGIELAAAWTRTMTPVQIAEQIAADLDFLATRMADIPPRHRSLRAVFLHSWALLTTDEQVVLSGLSVFSGGFTAQAAAEIVGAPPDILHALEDKSLLRHEDLSGFGKPDRSGVAPRYSLHTLTAQFAAEQLAAQPQRQAALADAHAGYYGGLLATLNPALRSMAQLDALQTLGMEAANIRRAWLRLAEISQADLLAACADGLYNFYNIKSWFTEGVELFSAAIACLSPLPTDPLTTALPTADSPPHCSLFTVHSLLLTRLAAFHIRLGQLDLAWDAIEQAGAQLELLPPAERAMQRGITCAWLIRRGRHEQALQAAGEVRAAYQEAAAGPASENGLARAEMYLGTCCHYLGRMKDALAHLQTALQLCRRSGDPRLLLLILDRLAGLYSHSGDTAQAETCYAEALYISRDLGDLYFQGAVANNLGALRQELARYDQALSCYQESLRLCRQIGDRGGEAMAISNLGEVAMLQGRYTEATGYAEQTLAMGREMDDSTIKLCGFAVLAETAVEQGQSAAAQAAALEGLQLAAADQNIEMYVRLAIALGGALQAAGQVEQARRLLTAAIRHEACDEYHRRRALARLEGLGGEAAGEGEGLDALVTRFVEGEIFT